MGAPRYHSPLESARRERAARGEVKRAVLQTIALGGLIGLSVAIPNAPKAIPRSLLKRLGLTPTETIRTTLWRLKRDGMIRMESVAGQLVPRLTDAGRAQLERLSRALPSKMQKWDGKWCVVIFDVPERYRRMRDRIRSELAAASFYRLQNSVWCFPYDCEEYITLLKADQHVGKQLLYMIVDTIENDKHLKSHFGLPHS